ncbi:CaiB/BaiF CoA transferase family protein [Diaphorobacter caeni]|uniref:CaiB/BaiF CoA transferase family protein n=1 Tax=Diaphorobacter caeni TaxID=2784387 RepID=UPI00188F72B9|nr:CoA transferase [Diaphorobacter caeni]MBF5004877.1 CoA transferase [Diaphorobacter caeni]
MSTPPLAGRRVIEIGSMLAAPFATHILSQLGAEVIKVEPPIGDPTRALVRGGPSGTFIAYSHGKKSMCLDLSKPEGRDALYALLKSADALVHNLAPKAARKLGVSRADCERVNPSLIYCHIRGYAAGPQADDLASNPVAEASTGVMEANRVNGRPSRLGPSYHDQFAGAYAVIGILASLLRDPKNATSEDREVEVGLYETGLHVASRDLVAVQLKQHLLGRPEREPHGEFAMPGYGAYLTRDERWLYLLMLTDGHWAKFCDAMKLPWGSDPQFATLKMRKKAREQVEDIVKNAIAAHDFEAVQATLKASGVGCTEVLPLERVLEADQAHQPGKLRTVSFRGLDFEVPEFPRAGAASDGLKTIAPGELGEHTESILQSLNLSAAEIDALLRSGGVKAQQPGSFAWAAVRETA